MKIDASELFDDEESMAMLEVLLETVNEIADDYVQYGSNQQLFNLNNNAEAVQMMKLSMKSILSRYVTSLDFEYHGEPYKLHLVK